MSENEKILSQQVVKKAHYCLVISSRITGLKTRIQVKNNKHIIYYKHYIIAHYIT